MQVKIFSAKTQEELEVKINKLIEATQYPQYIQDIKFNATKNIVPLGDRCETSQEYQALVIIGTK